MLEYMIFLNKISGSNPSINKHINEWYFDFIKYEDAH